MLGSNTRALLAAMGPSRRRQLIPLLLLMLVGGLAEFCTVAAVVPFIGLLSSRSNTWLLPGTATQLDPATAVALFVSAVLLAGLIRLTLLSATQRFAFGLGHELTVAVQQRVLARPYLDHVRTHSASAIAALEKVELLVFGTLLPVLQSTSALVLTLFLLGALATVDLGATAAAAALLAVLYLSLLLLTRRPLAHASQVMSSSYDARVRLLQESHGAIRDLILDGTRERTVAAFRALDARLRNARIKGTLIGGLPRIAIETLGIVALALVMLVLVRRDGGLAAALPTLGALALGAQRLLPLAQTLFKTWADATANKQVVSDVLTMLDGPTKPQVLSATPLPFQRTIELKDVGFSYPDRRGPAVSGLSFSIRAGGRVALAGPTGSGKSTVADLIMGLLSPTQGAIEIDGVTLTPDLVPAWHRNIAHVPQKLFLADDSIAANIGFGAPSASRERIEEAARLAQLTQVVAELPDGFNTRVGQDGLMLSGGQRQRLALARAILKSAPVLVLDEPTSALDPDTERSVLDTLDQLQRRGTTIIIIAHQPTLLALCDKVVWLRGGEVERIVDQCPASADS